MCMKIDGMSMENRWYVWASNEYGHGGNMSRDVKDLMGINSDGKWVRYEY